MTTWMWTGFLSLMPIAELRGGLPFALSNGIPWYLAYPFCVVLNALVAPLFYLFLDTFHKVFIRWSVYRRLFYFFVKRSRKKLAANVNRWGFWGLTLFVAIPLPVTGAWTGTLGAWVLGIRRSRAILAVFAGVVISGLIVSVVYLAGLEALKFFIKDLH